MIEIPRLMICEGDSSGLYGELARDGAHKAGWEAILLEDPALAALSLDESFQAVVIGLGSVEPFSGRPLPGLVVLDRSNELGLPKALLTGRPDAENFLGSNARDIVIPKDGSVEAIEAIPHKVTAWLINLLQEQF